jgi:hypothetical protein
VKLAGQRLRRTLSWAAWIGALLYAAAAGAQGFQRVVLTSEAPSAYGIAAGDFDGDGDMDAATTNFYNGSALWLETVPGSPAVPHGLNVGYGSLRGIAAGDFDSDGDVDLAVAAFDGNRFLWLENRHVQGADSFVTHLLRSPANGAWGTIAVDLDQDEDLDLVTTEYAGNVVRVFLQINGVLVESAASSVPHPMGAAIADWDGDGDRDIVIGSYDGAIHWLEQTPAGWVAHTLSFGANMANVAAADLDGDNDTDLIGAPLSSASAPVTWWEHTATGFTAHSLPGAMTNVRDLAVADFDQDGDLDIVASSQTGTLRWWQNTGGGTFSMRTADPGTSLYCLTIVDFDQDGDQDVLVADLLEDGLLLYRNTMGVPAVLTGYVRSADAQPVPDVMVRALETGVWTLTGETGNYVLPVASGTYTLRTRHPCWNDAVIVNVVAQSGDTTAQDFAVLRPILDLEVTSLNVMSPNGEVTTVPLHVENSGDGVLRIAASVSGNFVNDPWLSISPDSAIIAPGAPFDFQVQVAPDTSNDQSWDYTGLISIHTNACPDSEVEVAVVAYILHASDAPSPLPKEITLHDVYPNPFNAVAVVRFALPHIQPVAVRLFDVTGRLVRTLENRTYDAGEHAITIDGNTLASGVYLVALDAGNVRLTRKALLLK